MTIEKCKHRKEADTVILQLPNITPLAHPKSAFDFIPLEMEKCLNCKGKNVKCKDYDDGKVR